MDASGQGCGYISEQEIWRLNSVPVRVVLDVLSDDLENYIFGEEGDNFICLAATASKFRQENQQSASTVFSLDVAQKQAGSPNTYK